MVKKKNSSITESIILNYILIGFSVSIILFFTLFNRNTSLVRGLLSPGWTIREILAGDRNTLIESLENIVLFIPFGVFLSRFKNIKAIVVVLVGMCCSVIVEFTQFVFYLGWTEVDDVVYNTLGMLIGYGIIHVFKKSTLVLKNGFKSLFSILGVALLCSCLVLAGFKLFESYRFSNLKKFASIHDLDEHTPNLLVLNGRSGRIDGTSIDVTYNKNGTLSISGSSEIRTWFLISEFELDSGNYFFTGLQNVDDYTVALELEFYSKEKGDFIRLTPDIGPINSYEFSIDELTEFRAYIGVYECSDVDVIATPALYQLERIE